ncbi:MAG: DUF2062 domain-containing protein, partial [Cyanothece sp. SIO1E1]|nr:DUF2062 domain-containing protein [Cyanothece sp. SIO1E1]
GKWFLGSTEQDYNLSGPQSWDAITSMGADLTTTLLVGCTVMGLLFATCSYFAGIWLLCKLRQRHGARRKSYSIGE